MQEWYSTQVQLLVQVLEDWVGLRPGRTSVRLGLEMVSLNGAGKEDRYSKPVPVVHNYGHGGSGLTLAWGCAHDVVQHLKEALS